MKKHFLVIFGFLLVWGVVGCAPVMQPPLEPLASDAMRTKGGKYLPKVENFQVIIDSSFSMNEDGKNDFLAARDIVRRMNQRIPGDLNYAGGLRSLGHESHQSPNPTDLLYGMTTYQKAKFHEALGKIHYVGGATPMAEAIKSAGQDLKGLSGKSALIIVSDGLDMADAPAAAKQVKAMLGENLCIYTIAVGQERNGTGIDMMKQLADIGKCGFATRDIELADGAAMTSFVDKVFVGKEKPVLDSDGDGVVDEKDKCPNTPRGARVDKVGCPLDSDGDGVLDSLDKCPNTPKGAPVDKAGCPLDSDGDGVFDYLDKCPATPKGAPVDKVGCPRDSDGDGVFDYRDQCPNTPKGVSVDAKGCPTVLTLKINFGNNSDTVGSQYMGEIAKAAKCVNNYPGNVVFINGHTDSRGSSAYNQALSERRAAAVVKALVENFGISPSRLKAQGFGEDQPIADNATQEGRQINRRVDVACGAGK